jgi:hypothetical protein
MEILLKVVEGLTNQIGRQVPNMLHCLAVTPDLLNTKSPTSVTGRDVFNLSKTEHALVILSAPAFTFSGLG